VQSYLRTHFGTLGEWTFNVLVSVRLLSEVFANLLVVGIIFGVAGTVPYTVAITAVTLFTLAYAMIGGLRASLRTDVLQMTILLALLAMLLVITVRQPSFDLSAILASSPDLMSPGWVLLAVALLQVWSYPLHDPVMMDRGFLTDRATTQRSFHYAFWISVACILAFGLIGVFAGLHRSEGEALMETLGRMLSGPALLMVNLALVVSAVSTLDSALSSASKLAVVDMGMAKPTASNGRIAMAAFMAGGLSLLFLGPDDLFAAVAISGTAALFLAPVIFFCIWGGMRVPRWSYGAAFALALAGSGVYFLDSAGHLPVMAHLFGPLHDYTRLLIVNVAVLAGGCAAFALDILSSGPQPRRSEA
jgi:Na+/proline symporter